ncbi:dual specificity protein kinase kns1 [Entophlyctis luteolus]|nr:dual specificity protein kinase kns1 [Entophlyctis luteolus]
MAPSSVRQQDRPPPPPPQVLRMTTMHAHPQHHAQPQPQPQPLSLTQQPVALRCAHGDAGAETPPQHQHQHQQQQQAQLPSPPSSLPSALPLLPIPAPARTAAPAQAPAPAPAFMPPPPPPPLPPPSSVTRPYPPSPPHPFVAPSVSWDSFSASLRLPEPPLCSADRILLPSRVPDAAVQQSWPSDCFFGFPSNLRNCSLQLSESNNGKGVQTGIGSISSGVQILLDSKGFQQLPTQSSKEGFIGEIPAKAPKEMQGAGPSLINSIATSTSTVHRASQLKQQVSQATATPRNSTRKATKDFEFAVPARVTRSQTRRQMLEVEKLKQQNDDKNSLAIVLPAPSSAHQSLHPPARPSIPVNNSVKQKRQNTTFQAPAADSFQNGAFTYVAQHSPSAPQPRFMYNTPGYYHQQQVNLYSYPSSAFRLYASQQPQKYEQMHPQDYPMTFNVAASINTPFPFPITQSKRFLGYEIIDLTGPDCEDVQADTQPDAKRQRVDANEAWTIAYNRQIQHSHQIQRQQHLQQLHNEKRQPSPLSSQAQQQTVAKLTKTLPDCDDKDGHYIVRSGDFLTSRYQIVRLLGQGTFGKVVEAVDCTRNNSRVAIKIIRSVQKYHEAAKIEVKVLTALKKNDPMNLKRCIHLLSTFEHRNHTCMVFELLAQSIFDFLKENHFNPFPMYHIQAFARQILDSVAFMHDLRLIHTDLKPENLMLESKQCRVSTVNPQAQELLDSRVRLIDFGSAIFENDYHSSVVSTRHYRAPEIILGLGWTFPCDMWSIGCILVEFFTGDALFQTHDNMEHLAMMQTVLGPLPRHMTRACIAGSTNPDKTVTKVFKANGLVNWPVSQTAKASKKFVKGMRPLEQIVSPRNEPTRLFCDLIKNLLVYDPSKRITAREALQHPFLNCCL